jgi:predicted RNA-binding Zn-ribbon protein involved in translation (DUF1610 family)
MGIAFLCPKCGKEMAYHFRAPFPNPMIVLCENCNVRMVRIFPLEDAEETTKIVKEFKTNPKYKNVILPSTIKKELFTKSAEEVFPKCTKDEIKRIKRDYKIAEKIIENEERILKGLKPKAIGKAQW